MSKHSRASKAQRRREQERRAEALLERTATRHTANGTPYPNTSTFRMACQVRHCDEYVDRNADIPLCPDHAVRIWSQVQQQLHQSDIIEAAANLYERREANQTYIDAAKAAANKPNKADMAEAHLTISGDRWRTPEEIADRAAEDEEARLANPDIYYIRHGDLIKIGWSARIEQRLKSYGPTITVLAIEPGTREDERDLHRTFRPYLAKGREWYEPAPFLLDHIAKVVEREGPPWFVPEWTKPRSHSRLKAAPKKPTGISL